MNVRDLMTQDVKTCRSHDSLDVAASLMWSSDCGCVAVVDEAGRVVGMLTDRDICMAALTQAAPLSQLRAESAMAREVHWCEPEDTLLTALDKMRINQVRRLPVVANDGSLVGIISLNDLIRETTRKRPNKMKTGLTAAGISQTLAAVCEPRTIETSDHEPPPEASVHELPPSLG